MLPTSGGLTVRSYEHRDLIESLVVELRQQGVSCALVLQDDPEIPGNRLWAAVVKAPDYGRADAIADRWLGHINASRGSW